MGIDLYIEQDSIELDDGVSIETNSIHVETRSDKVSIETRSDKVSIDTEINSKFHQELFALICGYRDVEDLRGIRIKNVRDNFFSRTKYRRDCIAFCKEITNPTNDLYYYDHLQEELKSPDEFYQNMKLNFRVISELLRSPIGGKFAIY